MVDNVIIGNIAKFEMEDDAEITSWIDKNYGVRELQQALKEFLIIESTRLIFACLGDGFRWLVFPSAHTVKQVF
jgi:hypothetical protein